MTKYLVTVEERIPGVDGDGFDIPPRCEFCDYNDIRRAATFYSSMKKSQVWEVKMYVVKEELSDADIAALVKLEDI